MSEDMWVSWCDDGVTIICEREACMTPGPTGPRDYWWQEIVDAEHGRNLQPDDIARAMRKHAESHEEQQ